MGSCKQAQRHVSGHTDIQADIQADRHTNTHTYRQTDTNDFTQTLEEKQIKRADCHCQDGIMG